MRLLWRIIVFIVASWQPVGVSAFDVNLDSALAVLDNEIAVRQNYYNAKESHISSIRNRLGGKSDERSKFEILHILFDQYSLYQSDSAFHYSTKMVETADAAQDEVMQSIAQAAMVFYYTSVWMLEDAMKHQRMVDESVLPEKEKLEYYNVCINLFYRLGDDESGHESEAQRYKDLYNEYLNKVLSVAKPGSFDYEFRKLDNQSPHSLPPEEAIRARFKLLEDSSLDDHERALVYGSIYGLALSIGNTELAAFCNAMSAIFDIRTSTHETSAVHTLAELMNYCDDSERAVRYIMVAFDDALFFNSRARQSQIGSLIPLLETIRYNNLSEQKRLMMFLFVLTVALLIGSVVLLAKLFRRNKRLEKMKTSLDDAQANLVEANQSLSSLNKKLKETIALKDSYIMQSLHVNTTFLNLVESKCHDAISEMKKKGLEAIRFLPYQMGIKEERQRIMHSFDTTFLQVFPNFVDEFNLLLNEGQSVSLNEDGSLSTELRIFALMRLGIVDTQKIADFLNISVNSIYVYKARIKAKSNLSKSEFDSRVMTIKQP